mmetsp:Transcript_20556/g.20669  ORF Transcript_20556/g.20669 Transcript_20556/m.20669 type:complete len:760 (+) Transcript_20556:84-2363(+)
MTDRIVSPLLGRKRQRRGVDTNRRFADEIEKSRAVQALGPRAASRRPTRVLPDISGFEILSKTDIKRDIKDIGKHASLSVFVYDSGSEENEEEEDDRGVIIRSVRPPCSTESTIGKKKRRYASWVNNPNSMQSDLATYRGTVTMVKKELLKIEQEEAAWVESFETSRRHFISALSGLSEDVERMRRDEKLLYELGVEECGITQKKRAVHVIDLLNEMTERQDILEEQLVEYERVVEEAAELKNPPDMLHSLPIVCITVEPLHSAEDKLAFHHTSHNATKPMNSNTHSKVTEMKSVSVDGPMSSTGGPPDTGSIPPTTTISTTTSSDPVAGSSVSMEVDTSAAAEKTHSNTVEATDASPISSRLKARAKAKLAAEGEGVTADQSVSLSTIYSSFEKALKLNELALSDLDSFFPDDVDTDASLSGGMEVESSSTSIIEEKEKHIDDMLQCKDERQWSRILNEKCAVSSSFGGNASTNRKKRKGGGTFPNNVITLRSFALPQTPRGLPLIISPISTLPDRVVGAVFGKEDQNPMNHEEKLLKRILSKPQQLLDCEEAQTEQWSLQSKVLRLTNRYRRLSQCTEEWERRTIESAAVLQKTESVCASVHYEDMVESKRCRRDLLIHGLIESNAADAPLSPMAVSSTMSFAGGTRGGRANRGKRGGRAVTRQVGQSLQSSPGLFGSTTDASDANMNSADASTSFSMTAATEDGTNAITRSPTSSDQTGQINETIASQGLSENVKVHNNKRSRGGSVKRKTTRRPF